MIRQTLRTQTAATHLRLDRLIGQQEPFSNLARYRNFLMNMRRLYVRYAGSLDRVAELANLPKTAQPLMDAIDQDLQSTGLSDIDRPDAWGQPETFDPLHPGQQLPAHVLHAQCWGHAYVMEGSAMGASLMMKSAQAKLPASASTHYLNLSGSHAKQRWPLFVAALQRMSDDADSVNGLETDFQTAGNATVDNGTADDGADHRTASGNADRPSELAHHAVAAADDVFTYALQLFTASEVNSD